MHNPVKVIKCPACKQYFRNKSAIYWFDEVGTYWSDGYRSNDITHIIPQITRCDECFAFFWISPVTSPPYQHSKRAGMALKPLDLSGEIKYQHLRKLTPDEYAEVLALKIFNSPEEEKYIRTHLWWSINEPQRTTNPEEISPDLQALFEENLESLIYKTIPGSPDEIMTLAEMYRELGQFSEAENCIARINNGDFKTFKVKMRQKIAEKDRRVFKV